MADIKVMSFNLRIEAEMDGINILTNRKGKILDAIYKEGPDLIGFQEAEDSTRDWLRESLGEYTVIGCGRDRGYVGESAPLAFRRDKFEMIGMEVFWLSDSPDTPGTRYEGSDQSHCCRMATSVVLKPRESEEVILFVNTHTDHVGQKARSLASAQLLEYITGKKLPCILTGDFNAVPGSEEIMMLTSSKDISLIDVTSRIEGTFHGFGSFFTEPRFVERFGGKGIKIDYIFTNLSADAHRSYAVEDRHEDGVYISDHYPIVAFIEI